MPSNRNHRRKINLSASKINYRTGGASGLSGQNRKFVGGSGPGGGVAEVEAAGAVQRVFGESGELAVG